MYRESQIFYCVFWLVSASVCKFVTAWVVNAGYSRLCLGYEGDKFVVGTFFKDSPSIMPKLGAMRVSENGSTVSRVVLIHGVCNGFEVTRDMTDMRANDSSRAARSVVQASVVRVLFCPGGLCQRL